MVSSSYVKSFTFFLFVFANGSLLSAGERGQVFSQAVSIQESLPVNETNAEVDSRKASPAKGDNVPRKILTTQSRPKPPKSKRPTWNVTFAHDPGAGKYNGVVGKPQHAWNFMDHLDKSPLTLTKADGAESDVVLELSDFDGSWGIAGRSGVYHGYIYHNCRCVDLTATVRSLPAGIYRVYVYAHGDAVDQNAAITLKSGGTTVSGKATVKSDSFDYRDKKYREGVQYVQYVIEVEEGQPLEIISKRDGSDYAMLNAVQIVKVR